MGKGASKPGPAQLGICGTGAEGGGVGHAGRAAHVDIPSTRLILVLAKAEAGDTRGPDAGTKARRCRYFHAALRAALELDGFYIEQLSFKKGSTFFGKEVWALGLDSAALRRAAEDEDLAKKRVVKIKTPEGVMREVIFWSPFGENVGGAGSEEECHFEAAEILMLLQARAYAATLPESRSLSSAERGFEPLERFGRKCSVLALGKHAGVVERVMALHDGDAQQELLEKWWGTCKASRDLPLDDFVAYFGVPTAHYFLFVQLYARWLSVPAVLGVLVQVAHSFSSSADSLGASRLANAFMVFTTIWSTLFVEEWKRRRGEFDHASLRLRQNESAYDPEAPAAFQLGKQRLAQAFQSARASMHVAAGPGPFQLPDRVLSSEMGILLRFLSTVFQMCCLVVSVSMIIHGLLWIGDVVEKKFDNVVLQNLPTLLYLGVAFYLEKVFLGAANYLTQQENQATYAAHLKAYIAKAVFFQLANYLGWFLYVAFYMQDLGYLRSQLLIFMTLKQAIALCQETVIPMLRHRRQHSPGTGSSQGRTKPALAGDGRRGGGARAASGGKPVPASGSSGARRRGEPSSEAQRAPGSAVPEADSHAQLLVEACDSQSDLDTPDLGTEYLQLAILFATTTSFVAVFPLGPLFAFIYTFVSKWSDAWKLLTLNQRMPPRYADVVISSAWLEIFDAISMVSVIINCGVLAVSCADSWTPLQLVALEHAILIFKAYLAWSIPDQPEWVLRDASMLEQRKRLSSKLDTGG